MYTFLSPYSYVWLVVFILSLHIHVRLAYTALKNTHTSTHARSHACTHTLSHPHPLTHTPYTHTHSYTHMHTPHTCNTYMLAKNKTYMLARISRYSKRCFVWYNSVCVNVCVKVLHHLRPIFTQKSLTFSPDKPAFPQKRPPVLQKSPVFPQKSTALS